MLSKSFKTWSIPRAYSVSALISISISALEPFRSNTTDLHPSSASSPSPSPSPSLAHFEPKQCTYPEDAFTLLSHKLCPAVDDPLCIVDAPFDFIGNLKIRCATALRRENLSVEMLSATQLLDLIGVMSDNDDLPLCMLTAFYAPYCIFSARMAPFMNALPRVYPQLRIVACDASEYSRLHSRYGISGTPTIILWLNGMAVARMDDAPFSLIALREFVERWTDLEAIRSVNVTDQDFKGPLSSEVIEERPDWYFWLALVSMLVSSSYFIAISKYGQSLWEMIRNNYIEANEA